MPSSTRLRSAGEPGAYHYRLPSSEFDNRLPVRLPTRESRVGVRPDGACASGLGRLDALERKRSRYQDLVAEGHITFDELGAKLRELETARETRQ